MRYKRRLIIVAPVVLFVLAGMGLACRDNSALGRAVLGEPVVGSPVSDSEAAELKGGCTWNYYSYCGLLYCCTNYCYFDCSVTCNVNDYRNVGPQTTPCGGICSNYANFISKCGSSGGQ
jgi:hypothetical protein